MSAPPKKGLYGSIEVLSSVNLKLDTGNHRTVYTCRCALCGARFEVNSAALSRLLQDNAGCHACRKKNRQQARYGDLIGLRSGDVEVIGLASAGSRARKAKMLCRCLRCGREFEASAYDLRRGGIKTCSECAQQVALPAGRKLQQDLAVTGTTPVSLDPNRKLNSNSTSGIKGVSLIRSGRQRGKYRAYINFRRKQYHLGVYDTPEQAAQARKAAENAVYGEFFDWYASTYPDKWEQYQKTKRGKTNDD